ncbi:hypothetical protein BBP40_009998 [Aspergillus hancockii]|nr:hypothetical protein BBP40_009998 [Aspergillus hancockii]
MGTLASIAYGGNTLAVAINAAYHTVESSHHLYSISGHFLRAARTDRQLICQVENIRNSRTFQPRVIWVTQEGNDGPTRLCIIALADLHIEEPQSMVVYNTPPHTRLPLSTTIKPSTSTHGVKEFGLYRNIETFLEMQSVAVVATTNSIRLAFSIPTREAHIAVVGQPQTRLGGYPIRAEFAITTRSQHSAISLPPATAAPCTWAMVGL